MADELKPYRVEVIADSSGKWAGNAMRYTTVDEAKREAINLANRWLAVREWRVVKSEPDARRYTCESCGEAKVYGAEEIADYGRRRKQCLGRGRMMFRDNSERIAAVLCLGILAAMAFIAVIAVIDPSSIWW